jgi:hypothetical protein
MKATEYMEGLLADWLSGEVFPAVPGTLKIALSETDPGDDGNGFDEVTGGSYARQNLTFAAPTTNESNGAATSNTAPIVFSGLPATTATHIAIFDNAGVNMLFYGTLSAARAVTVGDTISIPTAGITLAVKGMFSKYLGEAIVNWLRGTAFPTAPTQVTLELSRADPLRDGTGINTPAGGDGYVAQPMSFGGATFSNGVGTTIRNADAILYGPATASWGTLSHAAVYHNNGNMLLYGPLAVARTVPSGNGIGFAQNTLAVLLR